MSDNAELTKDFTELFKGRTDAYGSWEGGCVKESATSLKYLRHLWGQECVGIYPMLDDSTVWWGCSDIDVNDIDQARNIQLALKLKEINSWVEKTVKGYHVWVFAKEKISARIMRRALLAAHSAAKVPAKEINPKQEEASGYGNYVRLPYPNVLLEMPSSRFMLDGSDKPIPFESFVHDAMNSRVTQKDLEPLANLYIPKTPAIFNTETPPMPVDVIKTILSPYTLKIFLGGPLSESDRSTTLVRLAYKLRSDGISAELAYGIIRTADIKWGKFHSRPDGEMHLSKIIADVYGE